MYDPTSRYAALPTLTVTLPDGTTRVMSAPRTAPAPAPASAVASTSASVPASASAGTYEVGPGERLDLLAGRLLGDTTRWWLIADANPYADAARLEEPGGVIGLPGG